MSANNILIIQIKKRSVDRRSYAPSKKSRGCQAPVAHACNRSYSGSRDHEDRGSKPVPENSSQDPISKESITKKWLAERLKW
jgi:hypothetical protein